MFENFSTLIFMPYLSQTFESYQRVKIYTYSVNNLGLKNFFTVIWNFPAFSSLQIEHYALKSPSAFSAIVFYIFLQRIILFMESIHILV